MEVKLPALFYLFLLLIVFVSISTPERWIIIGYTKLFITFKELKNKDCQSSEGSGELFILNS